MPDAAICFVVGFVTANLGIGVAVGLGVDVDSLSATSAGLVSLWIGLIGSMWLVWRAKGSGGFGLDFGLHFRWPRDLLGVPLGAVIQIGVNVILYAPLTRFISDLDEKLNAPADKLADQAGRGVGLAILAVLVVVGAPIVEELFYRGLLLRAVQNRFGPRVAIGASAVVFAGAHFELIQFPALLVLGLVLGILAVRYERIGYGVLVHAGFNALAVAALVVRG